MGVRLSISHLSIGLLVIGAIFGISSSAFATSNCFCYYITTEGDVACEVAMSYDYELGCRTSCESLTLGKRNPSITYIDASSYASPEDEEWERQTQEESCIAFTEGAEVDTSSSSTTSKDLIKPRLSIDIPTVTFSDGLEIEGEDGATYLSINYLGDYIAGIYKYLLGISTTIAIVMIMIGGLQWTLGGTSAEAIGKAKTRIQNAVTGLVLLLSTYLILFTVNPQLISLSFPKLKMIQEVPLANLLVEISGNTTSNTCKGSECLGASDYQDCMLRQYGGSASEVSAQLVPVTVDYAGHKATYEVHKKVQVKFQAVFDAIAKSGTTYDITKSFGVYNWRAVTSQPKYLSNHSWGTAVDINPDTNPYCSSECFDTDTGTNCTCVGANCQTDCPKGEYDLPTEVVTAFKDQGFDWLGDRATGKMQDYMHFDAPTDCTN